MTAAYGRGYSQADSPAYEYLRARIAGAEATEDDGEPFEAKMKRLTATPHEQQAEAAQVDTATAARLKELGHDP